MFGSHACEHVAYHSVQSGTNLPMLRRNLCQFLTDYMASHPFGQYNIYDLHDGSQQL